MKITVRALLEQLEKADPNSEISMIVPYGYPTLVEQVDVTPEGVILSGQAAFDAPGMPYA